MHVREFSIELWLPRPPDEVFAFFSDAANLDAITPPWLHFKILTPQPIAIAAGTLIDYRLRVRGFPIRWRTHIREWDPPHRFVDQQLRGPYLFWEHVHTFSPRDGGTLARDRVRYAVPFDSLVHRWLVGPDVERIFRFRREALQRHFLERHIG